MAIYFDRNFNKVLRGYNTEEVDAALDAIVIHCNELEEANKEFAEENNNLIDDNSFLRTEVDQLKSKITEIQAKLQKVEETYNVYRQKYGESKDMVERARKSSFDIVSEANENAKNIVQDAEKQAEKILSEAKAREEAETSFAKAERKAIISKFDKEIEGKKALSAKLEEDFLAFKEAISDDIAEIMAKLEIRDIKKIEIPSQPEEKATSPEPIFTEDDVEVIIPEEEPAPTELSAEPITSEVADVPIQEIEPGTDDLPDPPEISEIPIIPFPSAINEVKRPESEFSKIKNTLDGINDKVKNNKSTPHIN